MARKIHTEETQVMSYIKDAWLLVNVQQFKVKFLIKLDEAPLTEALKFMNIQLAIKHPIIKLRIRNPILPSII